MSHTDHTLWMRLEDILRGIAARPPGTGLSVPLTLDDQYLLIESITTAFDNTAPDDAPPPAAMIEAMARAVHPHPDGEDEATAAIMAPAALAYLRASQPLTVTVTQELHRPTYVRIVRDGVPVAVGYLTPTPPDTDH